MRSWCSVRPDVELQRGGDVLVTHDALDHVGGYIVVDEPGGVGVAQVVEAQGA